MVGFTPLLLVVSFLLSHMVYGHYSQVPVYDISTAERLFVMFWDIGVTISLHGLCAYSLCNLSYRFSRAWMISIVAGCLLVALECAYRIACNAFGEPIYSVVAGMMTVPLFLFLPLVGIAVGIGVRGWKQF